MDLAGQLAWARSRRYHVELTTAIIFVAISVAALSYLLGDLLSRRTESEPSLLFFASRQAAVLVVAACLSSAFVATLTVRYVRSGVTEHEHDSTRSGASLLMIRFVWHVAPPLAAWASFLVLTSAMRASGTGHLFSAFALWAATSTAVVASGALGLAIAHLLRHYASAALSAIVVYFGVLSVGAGGDEAWWGWLTPYMDDVMRGHLNWEWFLGYTSFYVGVTLAILQVAYWVSTRSRWRARETSHRAAHEFARRFAPGALVVCGLVLLYLNGAEASSGV